MAKRRETLHGPPKKRPWQKAQRKQNNGTQQNGNVQIVENTSVSQGALAAADE